MPVKIVLSPQAADDLGGVRRWLSQPGAGERARETANAILAAIRELGDAPQRWPESHAPGLQKRIVARYVILYRASYQGPGRSAAAQVEVVRILSPGQEF